MKIHACVTSCVPGAEVGWCVSAGTWSPSAARSTAEGRDSRPSAPRSPSLLQPTASGSSPTPPLTPQTHRAFIKTWISCCVHVRNSSQQFDGGPLLHCYQLWNGFVAIMDPSHYVDTSQTKFQKYLGLDVNSFVIMLETILRTEQRGRTCGELMLMMLGCFVPCPSKTPITWRLQVVEGISPATKWLLSFWWVDL